MRQRNILIALPVSERREGARNVATLIIQSHYRIGSWTLMKWQAAVGAGADRYEPGMMSWGVGQIQLLYCDMGFLRFLGGFLIVAGSCRLYSRE